MKSFFQSLFIVCATFSAMGIIGLACTPQSGQCTYEGLECPNALNQYLTDSVAYVALESTVDSLIDANTALRVQLAGCELQDHSKIPTSVTGAGMIHMRHDPDGAIQLVYREHDGNEYSLDYAIDDYFTNPEFYVQKK